MAIKNGLCKTTVTFSCQLSTEFTARSSIITLNCSEHGTMSVDATDIAQVGNGKNGWAWVILKSTGNRMDVNEQYIAVVKKWKAALP